MWKFPAFFLGVAGMLAAASAQVSYPAKVVPIPGAPLNIVSIVPAAAAAPSSMPAQTRSQLASYKVVVENEGTVPIVAYAIRYVWADANGHPFPGKGNCETRMSDPNRPALLPTQGAELSNQILHHKGGETLQAELDMVLTADGRLYGRNVCGGLQNFQATLTSRRATEEWILRVLDSEGAEKAKELLQSDLAGQATTDRAVLLANHQP